MFAELVTGLVESKKALPPTLLPLNLEYFSSSKITSQPLNNLRYIFPQFFLARFSWPLLFIFGAFQRFLITTDVLFLK
ncbi:unnamed protein product, partial [Rotaria magnacalcarata]